MKLSCEQDKKQQKQKVICDRLKLLSFLSKWSIFVPNKLARPATRCSHRFLLFRTARAFENKRKKNASP